MKRSTVQVSPLTASGRAQRGPSLCAPFASLFIALAATIAGPVVTVDAQSPGAQERMVPLPIPELLRIVSTADGDDRPVVRLQLRSGSTFEGTVTDFSPEKGVCSVVDRSGTRTVLSLPEVAAVTVVHAGSALVALQGGKLYRAEHDTVPSRLELRRSSEQLSTRFGTSVTCAPPDDAAENADCRFAYGLVTGALEEALAKITSDALGREALGRKKNGIRCVHTPGGALSVASESADEIVIRLDCRAPLDGGYKEQLRSELNKLL